MSIYKIKMLHVGPKDRKEGVVCLLIANNDEEVYEWIKKEPVNMPNDWADREQEIDEETGELIQYEVYNDKWDMLGKENFKEKMIRLQGQMNDSDYDFSGSYYGITLYGWELLIMNPKDSNEELIQTGFIQRV